MLPRRTVAVVASVVASSPSSTAFEVSAEASAWVCHSWLTAVASLALDAAHERRIARIDAVDDVGQIFAVADRRIAGEGIGRECHWSAFLRVSRPALCAEPGTRATRSVPLGPGSRARKSGLPDLRTLSLADLG